MSKIRQQHMSIMWHDFADENSDAPATESPLSEKAALIGRVGLMFLASGAGAYRVRAAMNKLSRGLGITCNAGIGLKSVEFTCIDGKETYTAALSNKSTGVNTDRLNNLELFCDGFGERSGRYSLDAFHRMLDTIEKSGNTYKLWQLCIASGAACSSFAFLLGAGSLEMLCTFFAAALGFMVRKMLISRQITLFANTGAAVLTSCFVYIVLVKLITLPFDLPMDYQAGYICSMLFVIPGFPLITGGIDLAKLDLRSGIERITYAILVIGVASLTCAFTAEIFDFAPVEFPAYEIDVPVKLILRFALSFAGVYGFSIIFNSSLKMASVAGIIGAVANFIRLFLVDSGTAPSIAAFAGALTAGLLASFLRRFVGFPRITITVPSIVIMVPGMYMYKGMYFISDGNFGDGGLWLCKALIIVISLPLGLVFARILTDKNFRIST